MRTPLSDLFFNRTPLPMWIADMHTLHILDVNAEACRHYGYSRGEFLAMKISDVLESTDGMGDYCNAYDHDGGFTLKRVRQKKKNGMLIYADFAGHRVTYGDTEAYWIIGRDLTRELQAEAHLHTILDNADTAYFLMDENLHIISFNKEARRFASRELKIKARNGLPVQVILPGHRRDTVLRRMADALEGRRSTYESSYAQPDGSLRWYYVQVYPIPHGVNNTLGVMTAISDITEEKKLKAALQQQNQRLEAEIAARTRELKQANEELDAFNYSISHDLKVPLRAVGIYAGLLNDPSAGPTERLSYMRQLENCVQEIEDMLASLLDFSRYSHMAVRREKVHMNPLIRNCITACLPGRGKARPQIEIGDTPDILADKVLIRHVLFNLLSNAVKFSSRQPEPLIRIGGTQYEGYVEYYVKDNGVGFDEKLRDKLFKPFSRLHSSREFPGHGAGLAIAARILARHGGSIRVESKPGEGATFYFRLPWPEEK